MDSIKTAKEEIARGNAQHYESLLDKQRVPGWDSRRNPQNTAPPAKEVTHDPFHDFHRS